MSIYDFKDIDPTPLTKEQMKKIKDFKKVDHKDKTYDDPKYKWEIVCLEGNDIKYGRYAVSREYKLFRGLTMGEFYGTSTVD